MLKLVDVCLNSVGDAETPFSCVGSLVSFLVGAAAVLLDRKSYKRALMPWLGEFPSDVSVFAMVGTRWH